MREQGEKYHGADFHFRQTAQFGEWKIKISFIAWYIFSELKTAVRLWIAAGAVSFSVRRTSNFVRKLISHYNRLDIFSLVLKRFSLPLVAEQILEEIC